MANAFQFLWAESGDAVVRLSKADLDAKISEIQKTHTGSAAWWTVPVHTPQLVVLEACNMINLRGLFRNHVKRSYFIWAEEK